MRKTKKAYEEYLNKMTPDFESEEWIIGGKNRARAYYPRFGAAMRQHDPIGFQVGFNEWERRSR
jgi:hypothetical protein